MKSKGNLECFSQGEEVQGLGLNQSTLAPSLVWLLKISQREYWCLKTRTMLQSTVTFYRAVVKDARELQS